LTYVHLIIFLHYVGVSTQLTISPTVYVTRLNTLPTLYAPRSSKLVAPPTTGCVMPSTSIAPSNGNTVAWTWTTLLSPNVRLASWSPTKWSQIGTIHACLLWLL